MLVNNNNNNNNNKNNNNKANVTRELRLITALRPDPPPQSLCGPTPISVTTQPNHSQLRSGPINGSVAIWSNPPVATLSNSPIAMDPTHQLLHPSTHRSNPPVATQPYLSVVVPSNSLICYPVNPLVAA